MWPFRQRRITDNVLREYKIFNIIHDHSCGNNVHNWIEVNCFKMWMLDWRRRKLKNLKKERLWGCLSFMTDDSDNLFVHFSCSCYFRHVCFKITVTLTANENINREFENHFANDDIVEFSRNVMIKIYSEIIHFDVYAIKKARTDYECIKSFFAGRSKSYN